MFMPTQLLDPTSPYGT